MRHFKRVLLPTLLIMVMFSLSSVFDVTAQPITPPFGAVFGTMSDDGRYIVFSSDVDNLVPNDTNGAQDIFLYDRQTVQFTRISVDPLGNQADGNSDFSSISADGRYVAFYSMATNLVANDTNDTGDTFVHDRQTGQTIRVSVDSSGNQGNDTSLYSMISGNGQVVMFDSYASNLVANDTSDRMDVFAHDLVTGQTTRVSVDSSGNQATSLYPVYGSYGTSISFDGRYIGFSSYANNLVPNDTNFMDDVFVHDRQTAQTTRVSVDSAGVQSNGYSPGVFISDDGRYASFVSGANNLVADDFNNLEDVFIRDRQTNQTTRISLSSAGAESDAISGGYSFVSADGRYVFFQSEATTLTPTDTSGATVAYIRDRNTNTTTRISINVPNPEFPDISITDISSDMRYILFTALSNLVASDTNNLYDIYLLDRQTSSLSLISGGITAPSVPTLIAPANGATVPTTTVNFSWQPSAYAASYQIQIATDNGFTNIVYDQTTTNTNYTQVFTTPGTHYWRVRGINGFGNGVWSTVRSVTVTALPPATPVLIAPINASSVLGRTVNFSWEASVGATSYQIQIATDNVFTNILHDHIVTTTSRTQLLTTPPMTFYWRVRAKNINGDSAWTTRQFSVDVSLPGAVTLISPTNGTGTGQPVTTFSWNSATKTTQYRIEISTNNNFTNILHSHTTATAVTTYNYTFIISTATYYWRVRAINPNGNGSWSPVWVLTIQPSIPPAPILLTPTNGTTINTFNIAVTWQASNWATSYQVEFSNNFGNLLHSGNTSETSYTVILASSGTIYWRVRASNSLGTGAWSASRIFTLQRGIPGVPVLSFPNDMADVTASVFMLNWSDATWANQYRIQIATDAGFSVIIHDHTTTGNSSRYLHTLNPIGNYYWRVQSINENGVSNWSLVRQFSRPHPAPILLSPENGYDSVDNPQITLSWELVSGLIDYQIQVSTTSDFTQLLDDQTSNTTSYTLNFPYYTRVYWRVRALGVVNSAWSEVRWVNYPAPPFAEGSTTFSVGGRTFYKNNPDTFFIHNPGVGVDFYEYSLTDGIVREIPIAFNPRQYGGNSDDYIIIDVSNDGRYFLLQFNFYIVGSIQTSRVFWYDNQTQAVVSIWGVYAEPLAISDNGRFVFYSITQTPGGGFTYVYDVQTGQTSPPLSINPGPVIYPYMDVFSPDSRYLYFSDRSGSMPIRSYDTQTGQVTTLLTANNTQMPPWSKLNISGDGRYLIFDSNVTNLVPNDTNNTIDAFLYDLSTRAISRVSVNSNGIQGNNVSIPEMISYDGQFVVFSSYATNLVPNDTNGFGDVFVHDRQIGHTSRVSVDSNGFEGNDHSGRDGNYNVYPSTAFIVNNGRFVVFPSDATNFSATGLSIGGLFFHVRVPTVIPQTPAVIAPFERNIIGGVEATFVWEEIVDATRYDIQIASDANFTNILNSATMLFAPYDFTLPAIDTYYWRVRAVNNLGSSAWSAPTQFVVGETNSFAVDEQQLFNAMQAQMTEPLQFVLFDITPTGIVTTLQFTDGAVVTTTVQMTLQNGLITIRLNALSGGSATQQEWVMQQLPTLLMGMLDDVLPDNYSSMQTMTLTGNSISFEVISEVD